MVKSIRKVESALGNGLKVPSQSELKNIEIVRKSIVASRTIQAGSLIESGDIVFKRPGNGISTEFAEVVIGMTLQKTVEKDEVLTWEALKQS